MDRQLLNRFIDIVGAPNAITDSEDQSAYLTEWRRRWTGKTPVVLKPKITAEVSAIMKLAHETRTPIVTQGGNTGLVGGQIPDDSGTQVIVSTARLNAIGDVDVMANIITVEAGVVLARIQEIADQHDRLFPLSLAAQGSSQIGGNLSTNAGGTGALAYGVARDLCTGLEVVLPDGTIVNALSKLKKDNTGYNLANLFIGAEGTLGIITAASLKLMPKPKGRAAAFIGLKSPEAALELLQFMRGTCGNALTGFELMARVAVDFSVRHMAGVRDPLVAIHEWYVLAEISTLLSQEEADGTLLSMIDAAFSTGMIADAAPAVTEKQRLDFWALREGISESQLYEGVSLKHDISVPVSSVPAFIARADAAVHAHAPNARICNFGHMGDGNLHYNISQPAGGDSDAFKAMRTAITADVHAIAMSFGGSISAEHGIGQMKRDELASIKDSGSLALMHTLKAAIDPHGIMNPGKLLMQK